MLGPLPSAGTCDHCGATLSDWFTPGSQFELPVFRRVCAGCFSANAARVRVIVDEVQDATQEDLSKFTQQIKQRGVGHRLATSFGNWTK